ncbi:uncharacterized protein LOC143586119 [Bidens hawaiensis]|uniref:uncharacterized protein LOC143586119 n=1 Tax=Bidens hawaiensis TaxID=980011 RepID=UPI00404AC4D2
MQLQELDNRVNEITTELLMCMGSLSPNDKFKAFDVKKTLRLAELYPRDFSYEEKVDLMNELDTYIIITRSDEMFANMSGISSLAKKMVETNKHFGYPLTYRLLKLALVLPLATSSVEKCFSSIKHVKTDLRNRMSDDYMNDSCICYIERDLLANASVEDVMDHFQKMRTRCQQL